MASKMKPTAHAEESCAACQFTPLPGEKPIKDGTTADQIIAKVQLICDDHTGVLFFRHNQKLYLRIIETEG